MNGATSTGDVTGPSRAKLPRYPSTVMERGLTREGYRFVAGVDEAGRGSWAGPLVAGAVVLVPDLVRKPAWCQGVCDSKMIPAEERERLEVAIRRSAAAIGVGIVSPEVIDLIGLTAAGHLAFHRALRAMHRAPDYVLVDAFRIPGLPVPQRAIIKGDQLCVSISAASIIAKTYRDRLMRALDPVYPAYGLAQHKGYGTPEHRQGLVSAGASRIHRHSWQPVIPFVSS
ncbi:MAG TPA: ribonuclease HII [Chloroflexota bacterium]|nr:ribonuclease HII [Chloroflexota bacterium]